MPHRKHRLLDPLKFWSVDFKHEFRRSHNCSVSTTIGINRSILWEISLIGFALAVSQNTVRTPASAVFCAPQATSRTRLVGPNRGSATSLTCSFAVA
jgi:hypothetical protein